MIIIIIIVMRIIMRIIIMRILKIIMRIIIVINDNDFNNKNEINDNFYLKFVLS